METPPILISEAPRALKSLHLMSRLAPPFLELTLVASQPLPQRCSESERPSSGLWVELYHHGFTFHHLLVQDLTSFEEAAQFPGDQRPADVLYVG